MFTIRKSLLSLALFLSMTTFFTVQGEVSVDPSKLSLSAQATISKPADELQLSIGVVTLGDTAEQALAENSSIMQHIIDALRTTGLSDTEYKTGRFSIHPTYTPYPQNPPQDWKPSINGYEVTNSVLIKTEQLELAGKLIDAAGKAGANSVENIQFTLKDPRTHWDEAISLATQHAINDAHTIANAAKIQLGRMLSLNLDSTNHITPRFENVYLSKNAGAAIPPIQAGDINITAAVSISYEIKQ